MAYISAKNCPKCKRGRKLRYDHQGEWCVKVGCGYSRQFKKGTKTTDQRG